MIDSPHLHINDWGIRPTLFQIGSFPIPSYSVFVLLGMFVAIIVFALFTRRQNQWHEHSFYILISGLVGGALGAKIPIWIVYYREIISSFPDLSVLLSGRTIVGGLIGGTFAVWAMKKKLGIKRRIGNAIAPAASLGIAIGRIGCFLRGCCYGKQTNLAWGVDFGDGIFRHPTQIYESIFCLILFFYFLWALKKPQKDGVLFRQFMVLYLIFRFLVEFIRVEPQILWGLTGFQYAALLIVVYYIARTFFPSIYGK
ncbi:prolipoprotein diacylglyceryl transferase [Patescibacteria group bacterium]|nr:prolipoprotein diacylglyceryl transferase [Patescibacteria group bacterium]MBU0975321.1 prolipoprotein diacylglyceryl transferase [Patescibacteria group bacterium]